MVDSSRNGVTLVAGNKSETKSKKIYSHLISTSEQRYDRCLEKKCWHNNRMAFLGTKSLKSFPRSVKRHFALNLSLCVPITGQFSNFEM